MFNFFIKLIRTNRTLLIFNIVTLLMGLAMCLLSAFAGELTGDEDYLLSIYSCSMAYCFSALGFTLLSTFTNTKFFHSSPYAEKICTRLIPVLCFILNLIIAVFAVIPTGISLSLGITDGNRMSDLLICVSLGCFLSQLGSSFAVASVTGVIFYNINLIPFILITFLTGTESPALAELLKYGFGVPLYISVIIFAAAAIGSFILSIPAAKISYKRRSTKRMINGAQAASIKSFS